MWRGIIEKKNVEIKQSKKKGKQFISKSRNKLLWELDEKSLRQYKPQLIDLLDDLSFSPYLRKRFSLANLHKEIHFIIKEHKIQERQIDVAKAKRIIKKLIEKNPKISNWEISHHHDLYPYFKMIGSQRHRMRIISQVRPGKVRKFG